MHHFKAFDLMNMQYETRICQKILNKATNDKNQHPPPLLSTLPLFLILFGKNCPPQSINTNDFGSVLYQQSRSRKKVFYRHIHPQDIYGQQQLVILHQMYQQSQTLLESIENMAAFVNQFAWHQIFLNYMHGLKSAVLAFSQNGLG